MNATAESLSGKAQMLIHPIESLINNNQIEVPLLPDVANKALSLAQNPDSDASEMANLIQGDQSLAAHVMRVANSVAYTPMANLVSVQQAIARLGMGIISEIAISVSIGSKFFNTPGFEDYVADIWRHAVATSLWAKEIARQCRSNVEVAFLAGLLHSIGRPAILQVILDLDKEKKLELNNTEVHQLEDRYSHAVSQLVVNAWEMPILVIEAVSYSENFDEASTDPMKPALVNAAAQFSTYMLNPDKFNKDALLSLPVFEALNLYQDELETLLMNTESVSGKLEGMMT